MTMELELLAAVASILNGDTTLKTATGINPATGSPRNVAIYNHVAQDAPVPYVRFHLTDTLLLSDETFDISTPSAKTISIMLDVFSDYEPECLSIAGRLQTLFQHDVITTTNYQGSTWMSACDFFTDNQTDVTRVRQRASIRIRVNLEPKS